MKMIRKILILSALVILMPFYALAAGPPSKGSFKTVPGKEFKFDGKTVEIVEFLSFYCEHCYQFEKSIPVIKGNFPKKIKWKVMPLYWGKASSKPGEAYLLAVDAGKGDEMKKALFKANFVDKKDISKVDVLESIAVETGLGFDFSRKLRSGEKAKDVQEAISQAQAYQIEETPTVIIAGNMAVNAGNTGHDMDAFRENVITIIKGVISGK